jgi:alkanesulfonate monooxygenase SsuD/methylene tetrahydromethanopterin reductase-like flavin-dependent oxidoreductase (luciferase family)
LQQAFVNLRRGQPSQLPPPLPGFADDLPMLDRLGLEETLTHSVVGSLPRVREGLADFITRTGADELIITSMLFEHAARLRSYELTAQARDELAALD